MTSRRAEIAVALFLAAIAGAAVLVHAVHRQLPTEIFDMPIGGLEPGISAQWLYLATQGLLLFAGAIAVFLVLPFVRAQTREHGKLHTLTTVLRRRSKEMEQAALTDVLTGLTNRRYFDEALTQFLEAFGRVGRPVGLMILDLDHFKGINDAYGHDVGDEVLRAVSRCLMEHTRYHDIVARLGGEEFAVVVPNMDQRLLGEFADRLRVAVEHLSMDVGNVRLRITMSVGLAMAVPGEEASALYKRADVNLYNAKQAGRNRICA
jgi:two-component system cell cycle response regulator